MNSTLNFPLLPFHTELSMQAQKTTMERNSKKKDAAIFICVQTLQQALPICHLQTKCKEFAPHYHRMSPNMNFLIDASKANEQNRSNEAQLFLFQTRLPDIILTVIACMTLLKYSRVKSTSVEYFTACQTLNGTIWNPKIPKENWKNLFFFTRLYWKNSSSFI